MEAAERDYDLNRAAELKYGTLMSLQRQLEEAENNLAEYRKSGNSMLREEVTDIDIAEIVSKWTGIPLSNLQQSERDKLVKLEHKIFQVGFIPFSFFPEIVIFFRQFPEIAVNGPVVVALPAGSCKRVNYIQLER